MRIDVTVKAEIIKARVLQISIYLCLETIWEILIMLETKKLIQQTLEELDNEHIYYLKYNGYNQEKTHIGIDMSTITWLICSCLLSCMVMMV